MRTIHLLTAAALTALVTASAPAKEVTCRVELDRSVLPAGRPQTTVVKVTLDAPPPPRETERPPVNLAIVLDRSGSMTGRKIEKAKDAAIEALRRLGPQDRFSLVIYNHQVETLIASQSTSRTEWIESRIREIRADGNTALFGGVSQAAAEIRRQLDGNFVHRIILLSDGLANVGPSSPADLARLGASLLKEQISVTTVGVGADFNEDLMTQLAQNSDGNTYFVESSNDLPHIFAAELGDVLSVVARKVILEIECPEGLRPLRIIGRDGRIRGRRVELNLNQLYGGQEKYTLIEIEVPAGRVDETREIASAHCRYEDALTQKAVSCSGNVSARFSPDEQEVLASNNKEVQGELVRNRIALAKDKAIRLMDEGKKQQAVQELKQEFEELRIYNADNRLPDVMQEEARELAENAEQLDQDGLSKVHRKTLRNESYQMRNQQRIKQ